MLELKMYQVDAFANEVFQGNPAAVVPLDEWLSESQLQSIATENNLSETAFFTARPDGSYDIRWFTPTHEAPLCGHATLASAYVVFNHLDTSAENVEFHSMTGPLGVNRDQDMLILDFPSLKLHRCVAPEAMVKGLGIDPIDCFKTIEDTNYYGLLGSEQEVLSVRPNLAELEKLFPYGIVVTARGEQSDFVSRYFAPGAGIPEDPVTGSIHSGLVPYWAGRLGKKKLYARQLSKRGGELQCEYLGERVAIGGKAVQYFEGTIRV
jgi:predicted PhzF superfamily epimerase YddE/YHI9